MTEKELFTNAMRKNMQDPSELSEDEILNPRKHARLRPSYVKYVAAAAAAALVIGAGAFFAFRDTDKLQTADDITPSAAQTTASETAKPVFSEKDFYEQFWKDLLANPNDYYAVASTFEGERVVGPGQTALIENCFSETEGQTAPKTVAEFFASADKVEYLGYRSPFDDEGNYTVTVDKSVIDLIYSEDSSEIFINQRASVEQAEDIDCDYFVADGCAYIVLMRASRESGFKDNSYFYKVTSESGNFPLYNGSCLTLPEWEINHRDRSFVMTAEEFRAQNGTGKFTVTDAENEVGFAFTLDMSDPEHPVFDITDIILPEGVGFKDGRFTVQLETKSSYGKNCKFAQNAELKTGRIETSCKALGVSPEDIVSVSVKADFDTTAHETSSEYKPDTPSGKSFWQYAYSLTAYVGGSRVTADS